MADGIGLSVGAAKLTAVHVGRAAVTRTAVLTRYPNRAAEVGVPSENPNLAERGLIITDFVDRVGDPVAIIAADGSSHPAEVVLADALRALLVTLAGNGPSGEPVGVAYPAHWRSAAVDALRGALAELPEFRSPTPALLVSDATAALTALQHDPGVPTRGVIALCDFGGTGTSITLVDAARGFQPVGPTVRYDETVGRSHRPGPAHPHRRATCPRPVRWIFPVRRPSVRSPDCAPNAGRPRSGCRRLRSPR